jgi:sulfoxide reductase catalytic subunit YedY
VLYAAARRSGDHGIDGKAVHAEGRAQLDDQIVNSPCGISTPTTSQPSAIKSIVRVSFTDKRPVSYWEALAGDEYGFWANVNPAVPHPRWSQETARVLGSDERVPTLLWNGYGAYVAQLYDGLKDERLFM